MSLNKFWEVVHMELQIKKKTECISVHLKHVDWRDRDGN